MGPVMNLALAVVVMAVVLYQGAQVAGVRAAAGRRRRVRADSVAAQAAGSRLGDRIVAVDGKAGRDLGTVLHGDPAEGERRSRSAIERDGQRIERQVVPAAVGKFEIGDIGVLPIMHPQIAAVNPRQPGAEAGLQAGDVDPGGRTASAQRLARAAHRADPGERGQAARRSRSSADGRRRRSRSRRASHRRQRCGSARTITSLEFKTVQPGLVDAFKLSVERNWEWTTLIVQTLGGLFTRDTSVKQLMGPVAIADLSGDAASRAGSRCSA